MEQNQNLNTIPFQPYTLTKPDMKVCYVAHLDMLGYKAFFEEYPDKIDDMLRVFTNAINRMLERLQYLNAGLQFNTNLMDVFKIRVFSDNVLLWMEYRRSFETKLLLLAFLETIKDFQINLICSYGIFLRGGVTKGDFAVSENKEFVFGKGLIDAVELESKAIYPRILIHDAVIKDLDEQIPCKGMGACDVCKGLKEIDGLFIANTKKELLDRIMGAYRVYDEILYEAPSIPQISVDIAGIKKTLQTQESVYRVAASANPVHLENEYKNLKNMIPNMNSLFNTILSCKLFEYERVCTAMTNNCFFEDENKQKVLDYLKYNDLTHLFTSDLVERTIKNIEIAFQSHPEIIEGIKMLTDQAKKQEQVIRTFTVHKRRIEDEVKQRMCEYEKYRDDKQKLHNVEHILKKYVWSMEYHNKICNLLGTPDLKIFYETFLDPIDGLLYVYIQEPQEMLANAGGQQNG